MKPFILRHPVESVAERLSKRSHAISNSIVEKTIEQYRIVETRVALGKISKFDRQESRAAVLLEYTVRKEENVRIPMQDLAAAIGFKAVHLQTLHAIIGNYLQPDQPTNEASAKRRKLRSGQERKCTIPDLAIRLAAHVPDPHGLAQAAQLLLNKMRRYIQTQLPAHERREMHYDMVRYQAAYEAAVFYCVARQSRTLLTKKAMENDGMSSHLELEDMLSASSEFTYLELKQVLSHVKEIAYKLNDSELMETRVGAMHKVKHEREELKMLQEGEQQRLVTEKSGMKDHGSKEHNNFQTWKDQVLEQAKESARMALSPNETDIADSKLFQIAADKILSKHGISLSSLSV